MTLFSASSPSYLNVPSLHILQHFYSTKLLNVTSLVIFKSLEIIECDVIGILNAISLEIIKCDVVGISFVTDFFDIIGQVSWYDDANK